MAVESTDIILRKSELQTNVASLNGGRLGRQAIVHGVRHALLPRVSKAERLAGLTSIRKFFVCNEAAGNDPAYDMRIFLSACSVAGDGYALGLGSQADKETEIDTVWCGVGTVAASVQAGETAVSLTMEAADMEFPNGGYLILADNLYGGWIPELVNVGDSLEYDEENYKWRKIANVPDITWPRGIYLGHDIILCNHRYGTVETIDIADNLHEAEQIGSGDGVNPTPTLTRLSHNTNGICGQPGKRPVVTATCGGVVRTVAVGKTGACSGYCSGGQLNMTTGEWTTPVTWTSPPDNGTAVACTYRELCYSYNGLVATVQLAGQVATAHTTSAHGCACVYAAEVAPAVLDWAETSTAGSYDEGAYPLDLDNRGTVFETWTLTFTSETAFSVAGATAGSIGSGTRATDFSPTNPKTGTPYFTLNAAGWGGGWVAGDTIVFGTNPAAVPVWIKQVVPAGIPAVSHNFVPIEYHFE